MLTGNVVLRKRLNYEDKTRYYVIIQANVSSCLLLPSVLELIKKSAPLHRCGGLGSEQDWVCASWWIYSMYRWRADVWVLVLFALFFTIQVTL